MNTLTYADLDSYAMSRASSFAAMAQQLAISLGVACAAVTLNVSMFLRGATAVATQDVVWAFLILGAITAASSLSFARLSPADGDALQEKQTRKVIQR